MPPLIQLFQIGRNVLRAAACGRLDYSHVSPRVAALRFPSRQEHEGEMDFDSYFRQRLDALKDEWNYLVFIDMQRKRGVFPSATRTLSDGRD